MRIETLDDLDNLLKLCHRQGVHAMKVDGLEFALSPVNPEAKPEARAVDPLDSLQGMSEDEILYWSSTGSGERR